MDPLLTEEQVAEVVGVKPSTIREWRQLGKGPPVIRMGPKVLRYDASELRQWLAARSDARRSQGAAA